MILLINTCSQKLNENEFVKPIEKLLLENGFDFTTKKYSEIFDASIYDKTIICGTALKDFEYLKNIKKFSWIKNYDGKILGICSGMQIIASIWRMKLSENVVIGNKEVIVTKTNPLIGGKFGAYFLISKQPILNKNFIKITKDESIIKHKNKKIYGCMFHPEVLNPELIINFCQAVTRTHAM
jgi:hypothetical protein